MRIYNPQFKEIKKTEYGEYAVYNCQLSVKLKENSIDYEKPEFLVIDSFINDDGKKIEYCRLPKKS